MTHAQLEKYFWCFSPPQKAANYFEKLIHMTNNGKCISLKGSSMCSPFQDFEVDSISFPFSSVADVDAHVAARFDNLSNYYSDFITRFDCPKYVGLDQRYHVGFLCAILVDTATENGCNANAVNYTPMCKSSVNSAKKSLTNLFESSNICTQKSPKNDARTSLLKKYDAYLLRTTNKSKQCIVGVEHEVGNCGKSCLSIMKSQET